MQRARAHAALEHLEVREARGQDVAVVLVVGDEAVGELRGGADGALLRDADLPHVQTLTPAARQDQYFRAHKPL
jgi:hypothetical protein